MRATATSSARSRGSWTRLAQLGAAPAVPRALGDSATAAGVEGPLASFLAALAGSLGVDDGDGRVGDEAPASAEAYAPGYASRKTDAPALDGDGYDSAALALGCFDASPPAAATLEATARLTADDWWQEFRPPRPPLPGAATLRRVLSACRDLGAPPRPEALGIMALFASDAEQRDKLVELATAQGRNLFREYVRSERRSLLDVLEDFDSAAPPLDALLDALDWLRPRQYSIASPRGGESLELCVARARYDTPLGQRRFGLASSWLCGLRPGARALVAVKRGAFAAPPDAAPLVFVGRRGVAPAGHDRRGPGRARSSSSAAATKKRTGSTPTSSRNGTRASTSTSPCRATRSQRRRATAALRARGAEVVDLLLTGGAHFFVAGNAQMASDVTDMLFVPQKMVTDHFDAPATPLLQFWIRGSSCAFLGLVYTLYTKVPVAEALPIATAVSFACGALYPWNAKFGYISPGLPSKAVAALLRARVQK
ncbi:NADPH-hemoprotein reductase [Aureococcus anophagefferens]|nr:NADPH-hemoprotein reductase [Aureococcus anophagefferens]